MLELNYPKTRTKQLSDRVNVLNARPEEISALADLLNDTICQVAPDGTIVYVNSAWNRLTGHNPKLTLGHPLESYLCQDDKAKYQDLLSVFCLNGYDKSQTVLCFIDVVGHPVWCDVSFYASRDVEGQLNSIIQIIHDISDRKKYEQALAKATAEWTYAMDAFEDPLYLLDLNDSIIRANKAFYRMKGLTPEQVIGRQITSIMHPHGEEIPCPVCVARQQRKDSYIVMEADHPNNLTGKPFEVMVRMIRDESGEPIGVLMGNHDLTRTRQTEAELNRLNNDIRILLESTGEGIFGVDTHLNCTFINQSASKMLGYPQAELLGKNMHALVHHSREDGTEHKLDECNIYKTIKNEKYHISENEVLWRENDTCFPVEYSSNPIFRDGEVTGAVVVFRDISESRNMALKMDYLAKHDSLTGLVNRFKFENEMKDILESARLCGEEHVLCYLDLDQFKIVNDTSGHIAGDVLLRQLSSFLQTIIDEKNCFARLGGDEFGILFRNTKLYDAMIVIEQIREAVRDFRFFWNGNVFQVGVSIGVVEINDTTYDFASALSAADTACYFAKDNGRNRVHVYQDNDQELAKRHGEMRWVTRIHDAIHHKRFVLALEPILALDDDNKHKARYELLVRMNSGGTIVAPDAFIPAAERYDLMPAIDRQVIEIAFSTLAAHLAKIDDIEFFAINLSGQSIGDDTFLEFVEAQFSKYGIPPSKICFEITETAAIFNIAKAINFMHRIKRLGSLFALDDFGSGMSSFAYLRTLPVDFIKIDGNFIKNFGTDPINRAMVAAIKEIGAVMGIKTIAEFVESQKVSDELKVIGIDFIQGHALAKPVSFSEIFTEGKAK